MGKVTYGAPRLVDWVAQIKAGAATVRVHFTGGALTQYGVTPAEYTTENPFIQKVIEKSVYFKEGRIIVLRRAEISTPPMPTKPAKSKSKTVPAPKAAGVEPVAEKPFEAGHEVEEQTVEEAAEESDAESATDNYKVVEASCLQDAQAYLQEKFNIASYKVRTYDAAQRAAAEHGVRFAGAKFDNAESNEEMKDETA